MSLFTTPSTFVSARIILISSCGITPAAIPAGTLRLETRSDSVSVIGLPIIFDDKINSILKRSHFERKVTTAFFPLNGTASKIILFVSTR